MVTPVLVFDATHDNIGALPKGAQVAGYTTGTGPDIRWTAADFCCAPGCGADRPGPFSVRPGRRRPGHRGGSRYPGRRARLGEAGTGQPDKAGQARAAVPSRLHE